MIQSTGVHIERYSLELFIGFIDTTVDVQV
jgi:hypothetical protein